MKLRVLKRHLRIDIGEYIRCNSPVILKIKIQVAIKVGIFLTDKPILFGTPRSRPCNCSSLTKINGSKWYNIPGKKAHKKIMAWNKYGMQYSRPAKSKVAEEILR